jgi:hypothetical protein
VDKVGGRLPMLIVFSASIVCMWGRVFIRVTAPHVTAALTAFCINLAGAL